MLSYRTFPVLSFVFLSLIFICFCKEVNIKTKLSKKLSSANDEIQSVVTANNDDGSDMENAEISLLDVSFSENKRLFQPTHEWKVVEPDEMIPPGLHIRFNLDTGKNEAKLRDERQEVKNEAELTKQKIKTDLVEIEQDVEKNYLDKNRFLQSELKEALKKLKEEKVETSTKVSGFRDIDDLKKDLKKMKMDVKLDSEIILELLTQYNDTNLSVEERQEILTNLEYYLHQIDNANLFVDLHGISLLLKDLNSSNEKLQSMSLLVLAAAAQSNPHAQVAIVENGLLEFCLHVVTTSQCSKVRSHAVFVLSTVLRNFPFAQKRFSDLHGFESLVEVLKKHSTDEKLVIKVITLVTDLKNEPLFTAADEYLADEIKQEKLKQYKKVNLVERILGTDWCSILPGYLTLADVDYKEKILNAMESFVDLCRPGFVKYVSELKNAKVEISQMEASEDQRIYFNQLSDIVTKLLDNLMTKSEL